MLFRSVVFLAVCVGCGGREAPEKRSTQQTRNMDEQATDRQLIKRAVFLSLIEELSTNQTVQPLFFLVLEPSEEHSLNTFYKGLKVRSAAECVVDQQQGVKAKTSGESGLLLEVKQIEIKGETAEVFAGYFSGAGVLYTFRLQKNDGAWTITEKKQRVISG